MFRAFFLAGAATLSQGLQDVEHHHQLHDDKCMFSFTQVGSSGNVDTCGMLLCNCSSGCSSITTHKTSKTWNIGSDFMKATQMDEYPQCVVRQNQQNGAQEVLATYSEAFAPMLFNGCAANTIRADQTWWADDGTATAACVKLVEQDSGHMSYILTSNTAECTPGWRRTNVVVNAYEMV